MGTECSQAAPCSINEAVGAALTGDEVIVTAGEYEVVSALSLIGGTKNVDIHGDLGGPMPRISASMGALPIIYVAEETSLRYVELHNTETEALGFRCFEGALVERVRSIGDGEGAAGGHALGGCTVRDSVLRANGTNALGIEATGVVGEGPSIVRNVTAIATGSDSIGIQSRYNYPSTGSHLMILSNSIAAGDTFDLRAQEDSFGPGSIAVSNSNFDNVSQEGAATVSGAANQTAPPLFVNAVAGDYRQAPGSPTIDAGSPEGIGSLDLAGSPRLLGAAPDIGAYEFVPPPAGSITSLALAPKSFKPLKGAGAVASATKGKAKRGTTVSYALTAAGSVAFTVERASKGRRVGGKCRKQTAGNREKRKCTRYKALKGSFSHQGAGGQNRFKFTGRIRSKSLKPGKYRLVGSAGGSVKRAAFRIVG
jgi:hypothetical protein